MPPKPKRFSLTLSDTKGRPLATMHVEVTGIPLPRGLMGSIERVVGLVQAEAMAAAMKREQAKPRSRRPKVN